MRRASGSRGAVVNLGRDQPGIFATSLDILVGRWDEGRKEGGNSMGTGTLGKDVASSRDKIGVVSPTTRRGGAGLRGSWRAPKNDVARSPPALASAPRRCTVLCWSRGELQQYWVVMCGCGGAVSRDPSLRSPVAPRKEMLRGAYSFVRRGSRVEGALVFGQEDVALKPVVGRRVGGGRRLPPTSRDRESGAAVEKQAWRRRRSPEQWRPGAAGLRGSCRAQGIRDSAPSLPHTLKQANVGEEAIQFLALTSLPRPCDRQRRLCSVGLFRSGLGSTRVGGGKKWNPTRRGKWHEDESGQSSTTHTRTHRRLSSSRVRNKVAGTNHDDLWAKKRQRPHLLTSSPDCMRGFAGPEAVAAALGVPWEDGSTGSM